MKESGDLDDQNIIICVINVNIQNKNWDSSHCLFVSTNKGFQELIIRLVNT